VKTADQAEKFAGLILGKDIHFFYKNNFITQAHFCSNLSTIPTSAEEQNLKFSI